MKSSCFKPPLWIACLILFYLLPPVQSVYADMPPLREFTPGIGESVGAVIMVQGEVVVMHSDMQSTFRAKADMPLFRGDTLKTLQDGLVSFLLNDGSQLTLASDTSIVINQSIYDPLKKERASFINMGLGKVRCWINKLSSFNRSEFRVKTQTAVLGVRGSDFIIISKARSTEIITLNDTRLEVLALAAPELDPLVLSDFERTIVGLGELAGGIESVPRLEADMLQRELPLMLQQGPQAERSPGEIQKEMMNTGIRVPQGDLVPPPPAGAIGVAGDARRPELMRPKRPLAPLEQENLILDREAAKREEENKNITGTAPYFPETPDTINTGDESK